MRLSKFFMIIVLFCVLSITGSAFAVPDANKQKGINWFSYEKGLAAGKKEGKKNIHSFLGQLVRLLYPNGKKDISRSQYNCLY